jgi:hypothetical protein
MRGRIRRMPDQWLVAILGVGAVLSALAGCGGKTGGTAASGSSGSGIDATADGMDSGSGSASGSEGGAGASSGSGSGSGGQPLETDSGPECRTADDCNALLGRLPDSCSVCPGGDGGLGCERYVCASGICQTTYCGSQPSGTMNECGTAQDCETLLGPLPMFCIFDCPNVDGGKGCEHYVCLSGVCQTTFCK